MSASSIRRIGVVGLGAMGSGIAQLAVEAGYETVGREVSDELGEAAGGRIAHYLQFNSLRHVLVHDRLRSTIARTVRWPGS